MLWTWQEHAPPVLFPQSSPGAALHLMRRMMRIGPTCPACPYPNPLVHCWDDMDRGPMVMPDSLRRRVRHLFLDVIHEDADIAFGKFVESYVPSPVDDAVTRECATGVYGGP